MRVQADRDPDASPIHILDTSSSILILANPSHQTAFNARKHLIRMHLIDPLAELRFIASLLSSQHCAKHAELWHHRRWLLGAVHDLSPTDAPGMNPSPRLQFMSREALRQELELISRACELYPRNYFAWTHRLICIRSLFSDYLAGTDTIDFVSVFCLEVVEVKGWIDRHVSDYSAIHYILSLSRAAFQCGHSSLAEITIKENLLGHAISLVQGYPTHEALWMYIRMAFSISDLWQTQQIDQFIENFVHPLAHAQHSEIGVTDDSTKVSQYARQFLKRTGYT